MKVSAPQSIDFDVVPEVGMVVMFHGQRYAMTGVRPHTRQDGSETTLIVWSTHCARCGDPFELATTARCSPNRRCGDCAAAGRRV